MVEIYMYITLQEVFSQLGWCSSLVGCHLLGVLLLGCLGLLLIGGFLLLVQSLPHFPHLLGNVSNLPIRIGSFNLCSFFTHEDEVSREGPLGSVWILLGATHLATRERISLKKCYQAVKAW